MNTGPRSPACRPTFDTGGQSWYARSLPNATKLHRLSISRMPPLIHARLEKLKPFSGQLPEIVHRIDRLSGLVIQPGAAPESVALFRIDIGHLSGPINFSIQSPEHTKSQSMESRVAASARLQFQLANAKTTLEMMEHLAILEALVLPSTRVGEIFFADDKGALPCVESCAAFRASIVERKARAGHPQATSAK